MQEDDFLIKLKDIRDKLLTARYAADPKSRKELENLFNNVNAIQRSLESGALWDDSIEGVGKYGQMWMWRVLSGYAHTNAKKLLRKESFKLKYKWRV